MNKIIKNYLYTVSYNIVLMVLPLITIPYKAKILGPENIGIYSYVFSVFTYLVMMGNIGINYYGRREIACIKENKYTILIIIGIIINIALNLLLIPKYEAVGAAIATILGQMVILILEIPIIKQFVNKSLMKSFTKYLLFSIIMYIVVYGIGLINNSAIILTTQIIVGTLIYMTILFLTKDDFFKRNKEDCSVNTQS